MAIVTRGMTKGQADQAASRAAYFNDLMRREQIRSEVIVAEQKTARAPITLTLGGNATTFSDGESRALASYVMANMAEFSSNPDASFVLPGGMEASGSELVNSLSSLILTGKF
jgi:hypothetical protein